MALEKLSVDLNINKIDIAFLTETWLNEDVTNDNMQIDNYSMIRQDRTKLNSEKSIGGGVCIYYRKELNLQTLKVEQSENFEILWAKLDIMTKSYIFCLLYFPYFQYNNQEQSKLQSHIVDTMYQRQSLNEVLFILGDFNAYRVEDLIEQTNLSVIFDGQTRGNSALDKVLATNADVVEATRVFHPVLNTDHLAVQLSLTLKKKPKVRYVRMRDQRHRNRHQFSRLLGEIDFAPILFEKDINIINEQLFAVMTDILNISCPARIVKLTDRDPSYISPLVRLLAKKKYRLKKKGRKKEVEEIDNRIKALIKSNMEIKRGSKNTKQWWEFVNSHRKSSKQDDPINSINANEMNEFFAKICTEESYDKPSYVNTHNAETPYFDILHVYKQMKKIKKTAPGHEDIPYWVYKENAHLLAEPYAHLFNCCLRCGLFPELFKVAKVVPIAKVNSPTDPGQYRPVSVTPIPSRLLERLIFQKYINENYSNNLSRHQFGYRRNGSTTNAVISLQNNIHLFEKSGCDYVRVFSLDLSKAFDKLKHQYIAEAYIDFVPKLNPYIINIMINFLLDRSQYVTWKDTCSNTLAINCGAPQGTVSAAFSFNLATSRLKPIDIQQTTIDGYADDNTVVVSGNLGSDGILHDNAYNELTNIKNFFKERGLMLNEKKSTEMPIIFKRKISISQISPVLDIPQTTCIKSLGFYLDSSLTFDKHISEMIKRASNNLFLLLRFKRMGFRKEELKILYNSLVMAIITYGVSVWGGSHKSFLNKIDNLQRKAVKYGVIDEYATITSIIECSDRKLYEKIQRTPDHPLSHLMIQREPYSESRLRQRQTGCPQMNKEKFYKIFPYRHLRSFVIN